MTTPLDEQVIVDRDARSKVDALFREARRRRRRRWAIGCCAVVVGAAVGVVGGLSLTGGNATRSVSIGRPVPPGGIVTRPASHRVATNLDILSGTFQMRVRIAAHGGRKSSVPAARGVAPPLGLARDGYVIGTAMGRYESVSNDLQTVLYRWPLSDGLYPAPASNDADVWLTGPGGWTDQAQEYDGRGQVVAPPVTIPPGMLVLGEVGTSLVLQGPPPDQTLALWDPEGQRMVAALGPWDQETTTGDALAWATGPVLRLATSTGAVTETIQGPSGDWATALAFSPNGSRIAVVWGPRPGSAVATTRVSVTEHSEVVLAVVASGASRPVPDSRGAVGPVAWSPDGSRIFFGQTLGKASSAAVASYAVGTPHAARLDLPGVAVPESFGPATGALVTWRTP